MNKKKTKQKKCILGRNLTKKIRLSLPKAVDEYLSKCNIETCFDHIGPEPIPSRDSTINILHDIFKLLYPGYFINFRIDKIGYKYYLGKEILSIFDQLSEQIVLALKHECIRHDLPCVQCDKQGRLLTIKFLEEVPKIRGILAKDVRAAYEGDPAAKSYDEIIFSYPGLFAITVYRVAHFFYINNIPLLPRIMGEYAHSQTGIDIHPGAVIGEYFFIDHGTGVVIGETTTIGKQVRLYQGVTLGALSLPKDKVEQLRCQKRHPTIEDGVIIYSGATILGGDTIIGAHSVIGGNVWLTESVPPNSKVFSKTPELVIKNPSNY